MELLTGLLSLHLKSNRLDAKSSAWHVQDSPLAGRGLFSNRDIQPGEVIFVDFPLVCGPRAATAAPLHCVVCRKQVVTACAAGCTLPVCSEACKDSSLHKLECELVRQRSKQQENNAVSPDIFRWLAPIRGLFLNNKQLRLLEQLSTSNGAENSDDLSKLHLPFAEHETLVLKTVSSLFNSHGFVAKPDGDESEISVRALYPLAGLMNHSCVPNTVHVFDTENRMVVKASVFIPKNTEILTTYSPVLWGTTTRRHFLWKTKSFWCMCERCQDPTEFGVGLNGLRCTNSACGGVLYPIDSLNISSKWKCEKCQLNFTNQKVGLIQTTLGSIMASVKITDVQALLDFVRFQLEKIAPPRSQIALEFKSKIVWLLGHTQNYYWPDLTIEHLNLKEDLCRELLGILTQLKLGQCRLRGLVLMELHRCKVEKALRRTLLEHSKDTELVKMLQDTQNEERRILKEGLEILQTDAKLKHSINQFINSVI